MITNLNYVKWIQENKVTLFCEDNGNTGGLDEILVPNPREQIELTSVSGVNRPF